MTDRSALPTQWQFPDIAISPGEFLLIWADENSEDSGLHANFILSKNGEFLGLYKVTGDDTAVVDTVTFGSQVTDMSYGRFPDGSPHWQIFAVPTPAEPNRTGAKIDSSDLIFDNTKIHNYELHFYTSNWADSLTYFYEHGEEYIPAQLIYEGRVLDSIGVRYKGNSSYMSARRTPKKPFKFKFDKYRKNQTLFDIDVLNFSNCFKDPSFMREVIGYDIVRKYVPAPRTSYANIYIEGELIGFYVQVEQVDELFLARYFENNNFNLYKSSNRGTDLAYRGTIPSNYAEGLELKTNEDENDWSGLIAMIERLNNTPAAVYEETMKNYLNLDRCCRLLAFNMVLSNFDSYTGSGRNFYLYDDSSSGQFNMIPWDLNETFGAFTNNWNIFTVDIAIVPNLHQRPLNKKILENESLRQNYLRYIDDMINGAASLDSVSSMADRLKLQIDEYVKADKNKFYSYQNFVTNVEADVVVDMRMPIPGIKSFSKRRNENLSLQLERYLETSVADEPDALPCLALLQNYPNPFNPHTAIVFSLVRNANVRLDVFNILGQRVATLVNGNLPAGQHRYRWQADTMPAGIYFCSLQSELERKRIKMLLLK
ncbi:CotH kinase family protein [candidate division KSB1 bacterium]|nr:CotH kinase family protein [candidate division KSB1 bacterium]